MRKAARFFIFLVSFSLIAQQTPPRAPESKSSNCDCGHALSAQEAQAMREDLQRMKALVQQMQTNLAFVDTTQSPLKHQFQLEIDMWQALITNMERRLNSPQGQSPARQ
jgi:uncharacterized membrane protein YgcG